MIFFKPGLDREELKKEYKRLAKKYHPDVSKEPNAKELFQELNNQFDDYFVKQAEFEYGWASQAAAREKSQKVRATLLVYLLKDQLNPGKFYAFVDTKYYNSWDWLFGRKTSFVRIKGLTTDADEWNGFRGGFAYCTYGDADENDQVYLTKLPAEIKPASLEELYFYNKATWSDQQYYRYEQYQCRFGVLWARYVDTRRDGYDNIVAYMKTTLPKEFLEIGTEDKKNAAMYEARQIKEVHLSTGYIREASIIERITGEDIPYYLFQDCTAEEFLKYHTVDEFSEYARLLPNTELAYGQGGYVPYFESPVIALAFKQHAIRLFRANNNFRMRYGMFDKRRLEGCLHLFTVDDIEEIEDFLREINEEFDAYVRGMIKKGKLKLKL